MIGMNTLSAPASAIALPQTWTRATLGFFGSTVMVILLLAAIA